MTKNKGKTMVAKEKTQEEKLQARIDAATAKRKQVVAAERLPKLEQHADDMEALAELEAVHGSERVLRVDLVGWVPGRGAATMVVALLPETGDSKVKRLQQLASNEKIKPAEKLDASETLARQCIAYPSKKGHPDLYAGTIELAPGILNHTATQIIHAVQGKAIEEGK